MRSRVPLSGAPRVGQSSSKDVRRLRSAREARLQIGDLIGSHERHDGGGLLEGGFEHLPTTRGRVASTNDCGTASPRPSVRPQSETGEAAEDVEHEATHCALATRPEWLSLLLLTDAPCVRLADGTWLRRVPKISAMGVPPTSQLAWLLRGDRHEITHETPHIVRAEIQRDGGLTNGDLAS